MYEAIPSSVSVGRRNMGGSPSVNEAFRDDVDSFSDGDSCGDSDCNRGDFRGGEVSLGEGAVRGAGDGDPRGEGDFLGGDFRGEGECRGD